MSLTKWQDDILRGWSRESGNRELPLRVGQMGYSVKEPGRVVFPHAPFGWKHRLKKGAVEAEGNATIDHRIKRLFSLRFIRDDRPLLRGEPA